MGGTSFLSDPRSTGFDCVVQSSSAWDEEVDKIRAAWELGKRLYTQDTYQVKGIPCPTIFVNNSTLE